VKAIVVREPGPPDVLELRDVETPSPGPNEVLIRVAAAGVNRADLLQRQGHYQPPPGASAILGMEVSGTIAEVGVEVFNWAGLVALWQAAATRNTSRCRQGRWCRHR
jgi:NADPH:quinone reductase-like Zn-dependent oxidoreductase